MDDVAAVLHDLPLVGFGFMLVVARVGTTMLTGPGLGENEIPATVRIALAVVLAAMVYPLLRTNLPSLPDTVTGLIGPMGIEILVGAWLGFITRVLVTALAMAGDIVSYMVGLSSVLQLDPSLGAQVPALQRMLGLAAVVLLFASGLYVLPIEAVIGSYQLIPPGGDFDAGGAADLVTPRDRGQLWSGLAACRAIRRCLHRLAGGHGFDQPPGAQHPGASRFGPGADPGWPDAAECSHHDHVLHLVRGNAEGVLVAARPVGGGRCPAVSTAPMTVPRRQPKGGWNRRARRVNFRSHAIWRHWHRCAARGWGPS